MVTDKDAQELCNGNDVWALRTEQRKFPNSSDAWTEFQNTEGDGASVFQPQCKRSEVWESLLCWRYCMRCIITGAWSVWKSIGRGLGCWERAFGYSSERDGESEIYFPSDLPVFPHFLAILWVCCILLKIIALFELLSGSKAENSHEDS